MSGIAALFDFEGQPIDRSRLEGMSAALHRHGPDGQGTWVGAGPSGHVALAHRMMKITPEDAFDRQPLCDPYSRVTLVADARIDNREELSSQLDLPGRHADLPDSAFIMAAYRKWGLGCARRLLGDFAFVLWDPRRARLMCARDPVGARVLYYHRGARGLALASAPRGLFTLPEVPRELNESRLADFLLFQGDAEQTLYRGIERVPPGHVLTATRRGLSVSRYWAPDPGRRITLASPTDYVEALIELLERSVRARLRSAGPVAVSLSGGIDSAAVAALAARRLAACGGRLTAFSAVPRRGFDGPEMPGRINDESALIAELGRRYPNLDLRPVRATGSPLDGLEELYRDAEAPLRNVCNRVWTQEIRSRTRALGGRVLLTGTGGNATFSYSGMSLLPELALSGRFVRLIRECRKRAEDRGETTAAVLRHDVLRVLWPRLFGASRPRGARPAWAVHSPIRQDFAHATGAVERLGRGAEGFLPARDGRVNRCRWMQSGTLQDGRDLENALRASTGVEVRDPTFDVRLIEFCLAIPTDLYLRDGRSRNLARRAMLGIVPTPILDNPRRGAQDPGWYERLDRRQAEAELRVLEASPTARRCVDLPRLRKLVDHWPQSGWHTYTINANYRSLLLRGLAAGRFATWVAEGDRSDVLPAPSAARRAS